MFSTRLKAPRSVRYQQKVHVYGRGGVCYAGKGFGKKKNADDETASREALSTSSSTSVRDENVQSVPPQPLTSGVSSSSSSSSSTSGVTVNRRTRRRRTPTGMVHERNKFAREKK